jgi:chemotaxis protein methyltransferase WspC
MGDHILSQDTMLRIEELIRLKTGLTTQSVGAAVVYRGVKLQMATVGVESLDDYYVQLTTDPTALQALIERVVIPETWFFRNPEAFEALIKMVLGEWLPTHPLSTLRILSVPCSTGEEPYSLAMAMLGAGISRSRFSIDAVDVSERALAAARRAVYRENSFRSQYADHRNRYCEPVAGGYSPRAEVRECVRFLKGNLITGDFVSGAAQYDVIFCRNVLIYFDRPTQSEVIGTLHRWLTPEGYLFVGPAEGMLAAERFAGLGIPMSFGYRPRRSRPQPQPVAESAPVALVGATAHRRRARPAAPAPQPVRPGGEKQPIGWPRSAPIRIPTPQQASQAVIDTQQQLRAAEELADSGQLAEAAMLCESALRQSSTSAPLQFLLGLVRDSLGEIDAAIESYRKTIFLDPQHRDAMLHLAALMDRVGDSVAATRLRERARRAAREVSA